MLKKISYLKEKTLLVYRYLLFMKHTFWLLLILTTSSCYYNKKLEEPAYAKQAYLEQKLEKNSPLEIPDISEQGMESLTLEIPESDYPADWDRAPFENIDEWAERIQTQLEINQLAIIEAKKTYEDLGKQEREKSEKIRELISQNEKIKEVLDHVSKNLTQSESSKKSLSELFERPPFIIHLVRKDETLYSIAMQYFNNSNKVKDIILWNQGWVQDPRSLQAGLGLALFFDSEKEQGQKVVDQYIQGLTH